MEDQLGNSFTYLEKEGPVASAVPPPEGLPRHLAEMAEELASGEAQLLDVREPQEATTG